MDINYEDELYSALDLDPNTRHDDATIINARIALTSVERDWSVFQRSRLWRGDRLESTIRTQIR